MSVTPFKRRLPTVYTPSVGVPSLQWWPWPLGVWGGGQGFDYLADGILPPRNVLDWLSVAEWRFQVAVDDSRVSSAQSVNQLVKPGSRYVHTYDMGSAEVQGRPSESLLETMRLGYETASVTAEGFSFCGIEMSWREVIDDFRFTYGFVIDLRFPSLAYNDDGDAIWSMEPRALFSHEITNLDGSFPILQEEVYINFMGDDYSVGGIPVIPDDWIIASHVTIGSVL